MKRGICAVLVTAMLLACAGAAAENVQKPTEAYFVEAAQAAYPEWMVLKTSSFESGSGDGEFEHHILLKMYRITDQHLELMELEAMTNGLREGDAIPWEETRLVPVEIAPGKAQALAAMAPEQVFTYGNGACFTEPAMEILAPGLTGEGESLIQLMACSETLIATVESEAGEFFLRIAQEDGQAYRIVGTPAQESVCFNEYHSWNDKIEIYTDDFEGLVTRGEDGIRRLRMVLGGDIIGIEPNRITDLSFGGMRQYSDCAHYGEPAFETDITKIRLSDIPSDLEGMLASLDRTGTACTARDDTPLCAAPGGEEIALCYTRVPGLIVSQADGWVEMQIGHAARGLRAWARMEDLAFGEQTEAVVCTFPSYDPFYRDEDEPVMGTASDGSVIQLDCSDHNPWLIGRTPDGSWLVLLNGEGDEQGVVCTAPGDAFQHVRPTEREIGD